MDGTRIFEFDGGQRGGKAEEIGRSKENGCYRTFNREKLAAGALAVNDQKKFSIDCAVF